MLFGITAVTCAVLAGNGGFSQAVIDLSHVQAETNPDLQGAFVSMFDLICSTCSALWCSRASVRGAFRKMVQKFYAIKKRPRH